MKPKFEMSTPGLVVFIGMIVLGIYDLGLVLFSGTGSSISAFMVDAGIKSPLWLCILSMVIGHFIFGMRKVNCIHPGCACVCGHQKRCPEDGPSATSDFVD